MDFLLMPGENMKIQPSLGLESHARGRAFRSHLGLFLYMRGPFDGCPYNRSPTF